MTDAQKQWLVANSAFEVWRPEPPGTIWHWGDVGYVFPDGKYVPDGKHFGWAWPMHLMGSGDTLYVMPKGAVKVGQKYDVC